jgi:GST-like protein
LTASAKLYARQVYVTTPAAGRDLGLGRSEFVAGQSFTIADIAHFGWLWRREFAGIDFAKSPNVARWYESVVSRPAVSRAVHRVAALVPPD